MKCLKCQENNPEGARFCNACGTRLTVVICQVCGNQNASESKYCNECGHRFRRDAYATSPDFSKHPRHALKVNDGEVDAFSHSITSERKHITVLFSDLSGYTAMSERLDPEEVKEILNYVFGEVTKVVAKYQGFIDKFIGDAVMILFGFPHAHEDDPIRAVMAAREIHDLVKAASYRVKDRIGTYISMHTGINTGLVVTDTMDVRKGKHGMTGDAINLASRLTNMAQADEILVGPDTYRRCQGYFDFEAFEPVEVKGKAEPVKVYRVLSVKKRPVKMHRLSGLRADLIGRKAEKTRVVEAINNLRGGNGSILCIYGDAGTGKSRLVEECKTSINLDEVRWLEGHAYAYSQNIPYFPMIDFLNRMFHIEEGDSSDTVRGKIERKIWDLLGNREDVVPYIGNLYALNYPETDDISPEHWKYCLQKAFHAIFAGLARTGPVVICLEDLHWADPSSVELLRLILPDFGYGALFLCLYRSSFSLFAEHKLRGMGTPYQEIRLQELPSSDAQDMVESLLKTDDVPHALKRFITEKVEGNPFYIEEVVNSLIESDTLIESGGSWELRRPIDESGIPSTLQGVIAARVDRLPGESKKVLQESAVIGRAFLYDILYRITDLKDHLDKCLSNLERLDVIKVRSSHPDLVYIFKHALTQEVVFSSLLKQERREIHERIGRVLETLFSDRLSEFYELLAFHFKQGQSVLKAVDYLAKSGEKSLGRYSLNEAHQYYKEALGMFSDKPGKTAEENKCIVDLINKWAVVYNQRGDYGNLIDLLKKHEGLVESLDDKECAGMFYGWLGWALRQREKLRDAYYYLSKALAIGEEIGSSRVIGYACAWLTQTCSDLGLLEEAIVFGMRAQQFTELLQSDHLFLQFCMVGLGLAYYFKGERAKTDETGKILLAYGERQSDIRSTAMGHNIVGLGYVISGDFSPAIERFKRSIEVSLDPMISCFSMFLLGMSYLSSNRLQEAEETFEEVIKFNDDFGLEAIGTSAEALKGIILIARGELSKGVKITENTLRSWQHNDSKYRYATVEYFMGKMYSQIVYGDRRKNISMVSRNAGFLLKKIPFAGRKAESHFSKAIAVASEIGARGIMGQANLEIGLLYQARGKNDVARKYLEDALRAFDQCGAEVYSGQAQEILSSL